MSEMEQDLLNTLTLKNIDLQEELENSNQKIISLKEEMLQIKEQYERSFQSLYQENEMLLEKMNAIQINESKQIESKPTSTQDVNVALIYEESLINLVKFTCSLLIFLLKKQVIVKPEFLNSISSNIQTINSSVEVASFLVELLAGIGMNAMKEPYLNNLICKCQLNAVSRNFSCPNIRKHLNEFSNAPSESLYQELRLAAENTAALIALDQKYSKQTIESNSHNQKSQDDSQEEIFDKIVQHLPQEAAPHTKNAAKFENITKMLQESEEKCQLYQSKVQKLLAKTKEIEQQTPFLSHNQFSPSLTNSPQSKYAFTSDILLVDKYEKAISLLKKNSIISHPNLLNESTYASLALPNYRAIANLCNDAIFKLNSK
jgi:hypothetical protein